MVKIAAQTREGAVSRRVSITAPTVERALELAGEGVLSYRVLSGGEDGGRKAA